MTWLLADLPVSLIGRLRSNRVMYTPAPARRRDGKPGRPPRHGEPFRFDTQATWTTPDQQLTATHPRYGGVYVRSFDRLHPDLDRRGAWRAPGRLPIVEGTIIHLTVDRLPGNRTPEPIWLWTSHPVPTTENLDRLWHSYLRRFDLEHTFRFLKQTLGFTRPRLRTPDQADRWAWLIVVAYTQLRLARHLTDDLRHPWEKHYRPANSPRTGPPGISPHPAHHRHSRQRAETHPSRPRTPKGRRSHPAPHRPVGKKPA